MRLWFSSCETTMLYIEPRWGRWGQDWSRPAGMVRRSPRGRTRERSVCSGRSWGQSQSELQCTTTSFNTAVYWLCTCTSTDRHCTSIDTLVPLSFWQVPETSVWEWVSKLCHALCNMLSWDYSGTSIIRTSFIWHLDYPDMLNSAKYINMHAQRACLRTFGGVATVDWGAWMLQRLAQAKINWLICVVVWMLLSVIILHRCRLKTRHHIHVLYSTCIRWEN